jgi:purine-cytosine permease-like protein
MAKSKIYQISGAGLLLSSDQKSRSKRYMWSMAIRMLCFGLALISQGILQWIFLVGSLVLPWIAVVIANAGRENRIQSERYDYESGKELQA